jgi:kynureninase
MSDSYRDLFPQTDEIYLLNHSVGRPPLSAPTALANDFLGPWADGGEAVWPQWLQGIEGFRKALAELLHSDPANFCPQVNLSSALVKVLQSRPVDRARPVILCTEHDFPSMVYVLSSVESLGYRLRILQGDDALLDPAYWAEQFSDDVGAVLLSHVHSNTGMKIPVDGITRITREHQITSIVDIAQSVGVVPIDLQQWQADFVLGSCVKWLCGGPGAGFLWVAPEVLPDCQPLDRGWFSHEDPFEFDIRRFRYAADARRFWGGTPSVVPCVLAANSIQTLLQIGMQTIQNHNRTLCGILVAGLPAARLAGPADPVQRGGTVVLAPPPESRDELAKTLRENKILFDQRATGLRLSPHIYNTVEEMQLVARVLAGRN